MIEFVVSCVMALLVLLLFGAFCAVVGWLVRSR